MTTTTTTYGFLKYASGETPWSHSSGLDAIDSEIARPRIPHNSPVVGATTTLDLSLARAFKFTVSQATTLALTNVPANTFYVRIFLLVTNGSAFVLTYPGSVVHVTGVAPSLQASGVDLLIGETWDAGTTWYFRHAGKNVTYSGTLKSGYGTSTSQAKPTQVAYQNQALQTGSTGEVSIASFSLPANALATNGDAVRIKLHGSAVTQAGQLRIKFGATYVFNAGGTNNIAAGSVYTEEVVIRRTGAATQISGSGLLVGTTVATERTTPAETLSGAITIDVRGFTAVGGGVLNVDGVTIEVLSA